MQAEIHEQNGKQYLVLTLELDQAAPLSKSGKTRVVASTRGNQVTAAQFKGQPITVGVNAYIKA